MPCSLLKVNRSFTEYIHLKKSDSKYCFAYCLFHAAFLLGLFFNHEYVCDIFLRNVDWISMNYTAYIPEDRTLQNYHCENLKSYIMNCFFAYIFRHPMKFVIELHSW
jgi:hypothetical protein